MRDRERRVHFGCRQFRPFRYLRTALRCCRATHGWQQRAGFSVALDTERHALASPDAEGRQSLFGVAALHLVEQRDENSRTGGPNGVAQGDGACKRE